MTEDIANNTKERTPRRRDHQPPCPRCGEPVRVWRIPPYFTRMQARCTGCGHQWDTVISQVDRGREELVATDGTLVYSFGIVPKRQGAGG